MNFYIAILILKMEEKSNIWHVTLYYFKKGKAQLKHKEKFMQCVEKVL